MRGFESRRAPLALVAIVLGCSTRVLVPVDPNPCADGGTAGCFFPNLADGLIAWWRLDDGTGATAQDATLYNNYGTLNQLDPATAWTAGRAGDGVDVAAKGWIGVVPSPSIDSIDDYVTVVAWGQALNLLFPPFLKTFGPLWAVQAVGTLGLVGLWLAFLLVFIAAVVMTRRVGDRHARTMRPLGETAGLYAATLLPIAAGYVIAHYLTLVVAGVLWLPELVTHPVTSVQPNLAWLPVSAVWYLSVGSIVVGHMAAIALAHRIALRDAPARPVRAGLPLVALMVGYTVLSLWIIAQPITIEPRTAPSSPSAVVPAP